MEERVVVESDAGDSPARRMARRIISPEVLAAAWSAWDVRHRGRVGPGPGFAEALEAGLARLIEDQSIVVDPEKFPDSGAVG